MASEISVNVPDLGDFKSVEVIEILVKVGDVVQIDTPLATLETEKATMDVPSTAAGTVTEVLLQRGDKVASGALVVKLAAAAVGAAAPEVAQTPIVAPIVAVAVTPPPVEGTSRSLVTVTVPDLGDFKAVDVVDVLVKPGDVVEVDAALATLETEKATMDVPSTAAGRVVEVLIARGDKVTSGAVVVKLERLASASVATASAPAAVADIAPVVAPVLADVTQSAQPQPVASVPVVAASSSAVRSVIEAGKAPIEDVGFSRAYAGPSVRLLARELGVDLGKVQGSGAKGRITHDDVKNWVKRALVSAPVVSTGASLPRVPSVDHSKFGPISVEPLSRIQKISGPRLHASWVNIPHVTQYDDADITDLEATRAALKKETEAQGIKLTPLAFIIRACVQVLKKHPRFNASLDDSGENLVLKQYMHIGFAADTPNGLVVPVLRDADRKDVYEIARDLALLSEKARSGKLTAADMQGGCFTISSLGGIGGTAFTPIINAPEVAILGVSKSSIKPIWNGSVFLPRLMLPLSLSYDHRVIDGASAARFTTDLSRALAATTGLLEAVP
jgi:pyruvate dehydrogenase E2 component (dihydrolipoamide acetyltransferase)